MSFQDHDICRDLPVMIDHDVKTGHDLSLPCSLSC